MKRHITTALFVCGYALVLGACDEPVPTSDEPAETTTLNLSNNEAGELEYCNDDGQCQSIPNPENCAQLVVEIDTQTGETCESCRADDGTVSYDRCHGASIACTLVTAPEPDCVVCAHIGGSVLYSSCVAQQPLDCEERPVSGTATGSAGSNDGAMPGGDSTTTADETCRVCYDGAGKAVIDECGNDCSNVMCPAVDCAPGFRLVRSSDDCCGICVPVADCEQTVCASDLGIPACPEGTLLAQDPDDCCGYHCQPNDCSQIDCPAVMFQCPQGSHVSYDYPNCCGMCEPDERHLCGSNLDCLDGEFCDTEQCFSMCPDSADPSTECVAMCAGVCVPDGHQCSGPVSNTSDMTAFVDCEGRWIEGSTDEYGCPLPPKCMCDDGHISIDGRCADLCGNTACFAPPPDCGPGTHLSTDYPNCCGICLPDESALCERSGGTWATQGCGHAFCGEVIFCSDFSGGPDGCNCGPDKNYMLGEGCVADPICTSTQSCTDAAGAAYPPGSSFPSSDGCNTCSCIEGRIACTEMACATCWGAWTDSAGQCRSPNDGSYPGECCTDSNLCQSTGGVWQQSSCGNYTCGRQPDCDAVIPGCDCGQSSNYDANIGCFRDEQCL